LSEAETAPKSTGRTRRWYVTTLLIVSTLITFLAIFAVWVNRQALNTDNWTKTSSQLLEDKTIRDAVAVYLVQQLYDNVDVAGELQQAAPEELKGLAGPASGLLRQGAERVAIRALATPQVQTTWEEANRAAHEQLLQVLEGGSDTVSTTNGEVVLNLNVLVERIADQLGIGGKIADKIPPDAGQLKILKADQLDAAQKIAKLIKRLAFVLTVIGFAGFALAVYLAMGYRRETLRSVGFGLIVAGVIALIVRGLVGGFVVDALATTEAARPPAEHVWAISTELLVQISWSVIISGLLVVLAAALAGPARAAISLRRAAAPYLYHQVVLCYGVVMAILVLFFIWAPTPNFQRPVNFLIYAVLVVLGIEVLRRETAREFPEAALADPIDSPGEAVDRVKEAMSKGVASVGQVFSRTRGSGGAAPGQSRIEALERLGTLKEKGLLTEEEFQAEKAAVLKSDD